MNNYKNKKKVPPPVYLRNYANRNKDLIDVLHRKTEPVSAKLLVIGKVWIDDLQIVNASIKQRVPRCGIAIAYS